LKKARNESVKDIGGYKKEKTEVDVGPGHV
jgi:hypothetical protein